MIFSVKLAHSIKVLYVVISVESKIETVDRWVVDIRNNFPNSISYDVITSKMHANSLGYYFKTNKFKYKGIVFFAPMEEPLKIQMVRTILHFFENLMF